MNGGSRIIDLRPGSGHALDAALERISDASDFAAAPAAVPAPIELTETFDDAPAPRRDRSRLLGALASVLALTYVGAMLAFAWRDLPGMSPVALAGFVAALSTPPALIGIVLLVVLRGGVVETRRFGRTAAAMRAEAERLEEHLATLTRQLEINRALLDDQARALMTLGDEASARLASVGSGLAGQVTLAERHATALRGATDAAQTRLDVLLTLLPRAHGETASLADALKSTGVAASEQAAALDAQLTALGERGREADAVADGAARTLAAHIARMDATSETAGARLEQVASDMSVAVDGLIDRTARAVDEARTSIAAQGDAVLAMLHTNQAALDRTARNGADALGARMGEIDARVDAIAARLAEQNAAGAGLIGKLDHGIAHVSDRLDALHAQGTERGERLAASISALGGSADAMTEALRTGDAVAAATIGTTERLLVALDAAAREIDETLPDALARLDARIAGSRAIVGAAKPELLALVTAAESTHDAIEAIAHVVAGQRETVETLGGRLLETLADGKRKADALGAMVDETIGRTHRFADEAAPRLVEALLRVRDTASAAADRARETLAGVIPDAAAAIEREAGAAVARAASDAVAREVATIAAAAERAADAADHAAERVARQVAALGEATTRVDARLAEHERAEQDTLARRVPLLIEALNSASIDIAKAFAADVADSAWAAYLKGDRGVFTRRAVRLLDGNDAREIARLHDEDAVFRDQVNRYIHDFEAMLRHVLAERDGSPIGVTLLSSDMGKLYVALAQAIERLRT